MKRSSIPAEPIYRDAPAEFRLLLRPQEAASALGVSLSKVMAMVAADEIPFTRLGKRDLRFYLPDLQRWIEGKSYNRPVVTPGPEQTADSSANCGGSGCGAAKVAAKHDGGPL